MPMELVLGPATISIVAGLNGTTLFTEPRVPTAAQVVRFRLEVMLYRPWRTGLRLLPPMTDGQCLQLLPRQSVS